MGRPKEGEQQDLPSQRKGDGGTASVWDVRPGTSQMLKMGKGQLVGGTRGISTTKNEGKGSLQNRGTKPRNNQEPSASAGGKGKEKSVGATDT